MALRPEEVTEALHALGTSPIEIQECLASAQPEVALRELQARVKKAYRKLARELHADQTRGDTAKEARLKVILLVAKDIGALRVMPGEQSQPSSAPSPAQPVATSRVVKRRAGLSVGLFRRRPA